ncbi:MAG: hypothetical protein GEV08_21545, partial [Acidimicrobiia bacterium]|nr:hypothetical protein [Acidimicrobiia bacterium]
MPALDRVLDYLVPEGWDVEPGSLVRIPLQRRRERGWVVATERMAPPGVALRPIAKVTGLGPSAELVELAAWAAW